MTKPGTNRHQEIHEKTLEEQQIFDASRTSLIIYLCRSFYWKYIFLTQEQAINIIRILYIIEHRAVKTISPPIC